MKLKFKATIPVLGIVIEKNCWITCYGSLGVYRETLNKLLEDTEYQVTYAEDFIIKGSEFSEDYEIMIELLSGIEFYEIEKGFEIEFIQSGENHISTEIKEKLHKEIADYLRFFYDGHDDGEKLNFEQISDSKARELASELLESF